MLYILTVDEVANDVGISHGTAFAILNENLALSKLSARWATKALSEDQLHQRTDLSLTELRQMKINFLNVVSLEMKYGSINMTLKIKINQKSGM